MITATRRDEKLTDEGLPSTRFAALIEDLVRAVNNLVTTPISTQDSDYTFVLGDAGSIVRKTSTTTLQTYTIPSNEDVQFQVGALIEVQNDGSQPLDIAVVDDTLTSSAGLGTGTRTLAAAGEARLRKVTATNWKISGEGVT